MRFLVKLIYLCRLFAKLSKPGVVMLFYMVHDNKSGEQEVVFSRFKKGAIPQDMKTNLSRTLKYIAEDIESEERNPFEATKEVNVP